MKKQAGYRRFYRAGVGSMVEVDWMLSDKELKEIIDADGVIRIAVQAETFPNINVSADRFENMDAAKVSFRSSKAAGKWQYLMVKADNLERCYHAYTGYLVRAREMGLGWFSLRHLKSEIRHYERSLNNIYRRLDRIAKQAVPVENGDSEVVNRLAERANKL